MSEEGGCRHGIKTDILRISYFIFRILILKSVLVFFTFALTSFDNNLFWGSWKEWKFIYILMSKHNNNYKYQMKSKFIREERLSEGLENTHSDNTLELTGNKNEFRCMLCNRNFRTNRGLIQHLNTCRRKQANNVLQHPSANDTSSILNIWEYGKKVYKIFLQNLQNCYLINVK